MPLGMKVTCKIACNKLTQGIYMKCNRYWTLHGYNWVTARPRSICLDIVDI